MLICSQMRTTRYSSFSNDRKIGSRQATKFFIAFENLVAAGAEVEKMSLESGNTVSYGFCANCGAPVLKKTTKLPELLFFHAGTLDDPALFEPQMVVFEESKQPWDHVDPALPRR